MARRPDVTITVYDDESGKPRWRAKARNSRTTWGSGEAFYNSGTALRAAYTHARRLDRNLHVVVERDRGGLVEIMWVRRADGRRGVLR